MVPEKTTGYRFTSHKLNTYLTAKIFGTLIHAEDAEKKRISENQFFYDPIGLRKEVIRYFTHKD